MPRKIRAYKADLIKLGCSGAERGAMKTGSIRNCNCRSLIAFKDGEDTPLYLEKLLKQAIQELETSAGEEPEE